MYLIVGAGLSGTVLANLIATKLNKKVLIIDKREHIGGNCFDYKDKNGIFIHKYGPHAFHTNYKDVWDYLSLFTKWHYYFHKVEAVVDGNFIPLPFNFNTLYKLFPKNYVKKIENKLLDKFNFNKRITILELLKQDDKLLKELANYVYENIYKNYSFKQWGVEIEKLDKSILSRVPILLSKDNRYFQDKYQAIPLNGYTKMFENMLDNKNIKIELNTNFIDIKKDLKRFKKIIYTGCIDHFFDFKYGKLDYRSLEFEIRTLKKDKYQNVAQVNYPQNYDFTRIVEFKHFLPSNSKNSTISIEYPKKFNENNEPFYPILTQSNISIYKKYYNESKKLTNTIFIGRLAEFKYYNMDGIVKKALDKFKDTKWI